MSRRNRLHWIIQCIEEGQPLSAEDHEFLMGPLWQAFEHGVLDEVFQLEDIPTLSARTLEIRNAYATQLNVSGDPRAAAELVATQFNIEPESVRRIHHRYAAHEWNRVRTPPK